MKISRKLNLYLMHILYLFVFFSFLLTINIIRDFVNSDIQKIEITRFDLMCPILGALMFWLVFTLSGRLSKTINKNYED